MMCKVCKFFGSAKCKYKNSDPFDAACSKFAVCEGVEVAN